jgi:hypothetical protein
MIGIPLKGHLPLLVYDEYKVFKTSSTPAVFKETITITVTIDHYDR